jgi:ATP:ADP antiporter, AAA family
LGAMDTESLLRLLKIRREEAPTAFLMALFFFLALTGTSVIKSLQNSLYLSNVGFDWRLPMLYVSIALLSGPVVLTYRRLSRRSFQWILTAATLIFLLSGVIFFSLTLGDGPRILFPIFYVWGGVFTVLLPIQGWMLSYELYTPGEAKRLFAIFAAGGIAGGAFGGFYTAWLAGSDGNERLLLHVAVLIVAVGALMFLIHRLNCTHCPDDEFRARMKVSPREPERSPFQFRKVWRSQYLRHLAGMVLLTGVATTLIDLLYKWVLDARFEGAELEITRFFGLLLGSIFVVSAVFQLFGTSRLLRRFGIAFGIFTLPCSLMIGGVAVFATASFWSVVILKLLDGSLRNSMDRTSNELLYVPLIDFPTAPLKSLIDLGMFKLGDAGGAALFLTVILAMQNSIHWTGALIALTAFLWTLIALRLGAQYVGVLRQSLERRVPSQERKKSSVGEASGVDLLVEAVESSEPRKVQFALQQLIDRSNRRELSSAETLHQGEESISSIVSTFGGQRPRWLRSVAMLLDHEDSMISASALHLMVLHEPEEFEERLEQAFQNEQPPHVRYLLYLARFHEDPGRLLKAEQVRMWQGRFDAASGELMSRLLGRIGNPEFGELLIGWVDRPERNWARSSLIALGNLKNPLNLDLLLAHLENQWSRGAARKALISYGPPIVSWLQEMLLDPAVSIAIKREIPPILYSIDSPTTDEVLIASLYLPDSIVSFRALKGLNKRFARNGRPFPMATFLPSLQLRVREYYELLALHHSVKHHAGSACRLLRKAVQERLSWRLEIVFRTLGLFLPKEDAFISYRAITSDHHLLREHAIELIDSHLRGEARQTVLPLFQEFDSARVLQRGRELFEIPMEFEPLLGEAILGGDAWLKCCVIAAAASHGTRELKRAVLLAQNEIHPLVRETARWAIDNWDSKTIEAFRC